MSNGLKLMIIAAGTIIQCIVVSIAIQLAKVSRSTSNQYEHYLNSIYNDLSTVDLTMYDGLEVYGSDVINLIKRELGKFDGVKQGPIKVTVSTSITPYVEYTYDNGIYIEDMQNFTSKRYIHPLNKFRGTVIYNANEVIEKIVFVIQ